MFFEIAAFSVGALFVLWLALAWRLSQGPISANFLIDPVENYTNTSQSTMVVDIGSAEFTWQGYRSPVELLARDVSLSLPDGSPAVVIPEVGIRFSKADLFLGRLAPRMVTLYEPALRVTRQQDGRVVLNVGDRDEQEQPPPRQAELIQTLLDRLNNQEAESAFLQALKRVQVSGAALTYHDESADIDLYATRANIDLVRSPKGLLAIIAFQLHAEKGQIAPIHGSFYHEWHSGDKQLNVSFENLNPSLFFAHVQSLKKHGDANLPLKGKVHLILDRDLKPYSGDVQVTTGKGRVTLPQLYDHALDIESIQLVAKLNAQDQRLEISSLDVVTPGPTAHARGEITRDDQGAAYSFSATASDLLLDDLAKWWPLGMSDDARAWVTENLSHGIVSSASVKAAGRMLDDMRSFEISDLNGEIDFSNVTVDYFNPLKPVQGVNGKAVYDLKQFVMDLHGGNVDDLTITKADIAITDLDKVTETIHANIDIKLSLNGPLRTALQLLDTPPLEYPSALGLNLIGIEGRAQVDAQFRFPLYNDLEIDEVDVKANAVLETVVLNDIVSGMALTGGPLRVNVTKEKMVTAGTAYLGDVPLDLNWSKNFSDQSAFDQKIDATLTLDGPSMVRFGLPKDLEPQGIMPTRVHFESRQDGAATLALDGDITGLIFSADTVGFRKNAGNEGRLRLAVGLNKGKPQEIKNLSLETGGLVLKGEAVLTPEGDDFKTIFLSTLMTGETDVALHIENLGDAGYRLNISGKSFDARPLLKTGAPYNPNDPIMPGSALRVTMDIATLITSDVVPLEQVRLFLIREEWGRVDQLELQGLAGARPINLKYYPQGGTRSLRLEAENAGAALAALGIADGVRGGRLVVSGNSLPGGGPRDMAGGVELSDFTVIDAPVLARLLNVFSPTGLGDLLGGKGISFERARARFTWLDVWPPQTGAPRRVIEVKDGRTSGASLGLTVEGQIDQLAQTFDLNGTIVPVSDLNKAVGQIPVLGNILTGGGKGVFAATYSIKGPQSQPTTTVNPLAALAPGFLRTLFFEN